MLFLGLVANLNCKKEEQEVKPDSKVRQDKKDKKDKEAEEDEEDEEDEGDEGDEEEDKGDVNVDINVDVNSEVNESDGGINIEIKNKDEVNIDQDALLVLNIDKDYQKYYDLWECRKGDVINSYFLNKAPRTIDDKGTTTERKRMCELFNIRSIKDEKPKVTLYFYAHFEKDFCEKQLNSILEDVQSADGKDEGFECKNFEDLSFLF